MLFFSPNTRFSKASVPYPSKCVTLSPARRRLTNFPAPRLSASPRIETRHVTRRILCVTGPKHRRHTWGTLWFPVMKTCTRILTHTHARTVAHTYKQTETQRTHTHTHTRNEAWPAEAWCWVKSLNLELLHQND